MSKFVFEALKRYVLLNLIESTQMGEPSDFMKMINSNALDTAKTVQEISSMFGTKPNPQYVQPQTTGQNPIVNPFMQQPYPQINPFAQQTPVQPVSPAYTNEQVIQMMTGMQQQFVEMQNQMFSGLQELYNTLQTLVNVLKEKNLKT